MRTCCLIFFSFWLMLSEGWAFSEKVYVVERGRSRLSVLHGGRLVGRIEGLGKLHHATVKFWRGHAFLISRDGFLSKIDTKTDKVVKKVKVGKSSIGLTFVEDRIAVANYNPHDVVLLDEDLRIRKRLVTGGRNVGIKSWRHLLVVALMDKDALWIFDAQKGFALVHKVPFAGKMPYDALISKHYYLSAFFKERVMGVLDLQNKRYQRVVLPLASKGIPYKIPHFGMWGTWKGIAYLPVAGTQQLAMLEMSNFQKKGQIKLAGLPVFAVLSPDGMWIAVNYSGKDQDFLSLIDRKSGKVIFHQKIGRRLMHLRFSPDSRRLYVSSYFEHKVHLFSLKPWKKIASVVVPTPSGLFMVTP